MLHCETYLTGALLFRAFETRFQLLLFILQLCYSSVRQLGSRDSRAGRAANNLRAGLFTSSRVHLLPSHRVIVVDQP